MSQSNERLFTLMAHAEDLQKIAEEQVRGITLAARQLEINSVKAVTDKIQGGIDRTLAETKNGLQEAIRGLAEASANAKASSAFLKRAGLMQGFFLLVVAVIIFAVVYFASGLLLKSRSDELAELKDKITAERATLGELQSKTWSLELITYSSGARGIILPKGVQANNPVRLDDGKIAIVIK